jgi:SanA protein
MFNHLKKYKGLYYNLFFAISIILFGLSYKANQIIISHSQPYISHDIHQVKPTKVALLLGTSKYLKSGKPNAYFFNRIEATIALFKNHKISYVIISGDNSRKDYNEPLDMKNELLKNGIAEDRIYLDYAGFRTYDSVIRAKKIFGQDTILFISQEFHNQRAVFIARQNGIEGYGFNAKDVTAFNGLKTMIREFFARDKVFIDAWINKEPKFLGEKIIIP